MPDLNHRLQSGRMNKDLDERLVPNGEYRDAMNAQVGTSDGSDVGSLQNILGNIDLSSTIINPGGTLSDFYCVGSIKDSKTDRLYWLLSGSGIDIIAEYDYKTEVVSPIVVDVFPINVNPVGDNDRVLNFDKSFLITGINIIEDILLWTDNNSEPKKINIPQVRIGSVDFSTHTEFHVPNPDMNSVVPYVSVGPITEEHITVIKKGPKTAPRLEMKNTNRADLNEDGTPGDVETTLTNPDLTGFFDQNTGNYVTTPISITFDTAPDFKLKDKLVIEATSAGTSKKQQMVVDIVGGGGFDVNGNPIAVPFGSGWNGTCDIEIISWDLNIDLTQVSWDVTLKQEDPLFEFKFPRFGYRYKYSDGEYSTFSPFSEVAFLPGDFDYIPKEGYNLGMVNNVRSLGVCDFVDLRSIPDDVVSIDILYKESNSPIVYSVKTIKRVSIDPGGKYDEWNAINSSALTTGWDNTTGYLNVKSELIHAAIPANQLLRGWDNVPRKALAQEIVGNRVVYGNYLQNYSLTNSRPQRPTALRYGDSGSQMVLPRSKNIITDLKLIQKSRAIGGLIPEQLDAGIVYDYHSAKTIKSLRTYQLGVVYIDEFGRETPVFSNSKNNTNTVHVEKTSAPLQTKLKAQIGNAKPDWAKHFKFLIKETSNEYYNLAMDRWYLAEDGNIWLSFPSSERNKVQAGDFLTLKKAHDSSEAVVDPSKYKILDIDNEAPLFLKTKRQPKGQLTDGIDDGSGSALVLIGGPNGTSGVGFPVPQGAFMTVEKDAVQPIVDRILDAGTAGYEFRLVSIDGASGWYGIKNITEDPTGHYKITSKERFGVDMSITSTPSGGGYGNCKIEFTKKEIVNKPEFDGRFFAKILKDATLQEYIVGYELGAQSQYLVSNAIQAQYINPSAPGFTVGSDWYGIDKDKISISPYNEDNNYSIGGTGKGDEYWKRAGNTPYTGSSSSGWFIDKIEAFRAFKFTKKAFGVDNSVSTNPSSGITFSTAYPNNSCGPTKQLQLIGTGSDYSGGTNTYLGINNCLKPEDTLRDASVGDNGHIVPSEGINSGAGIIHLSYAGTGDDSQSWGNLTGLTSLKSWFGDTNWAGDYVGEIAFVNSITTPGTIWRWKEDPGSVVYKTKANDPTVTGYSSAEWNANQIDARDNQLGTELWNYTKLSDYGIKHNFEARWGIPAVWTYIGDIDEATFVSQGITDHVGYFPSFVLAGAAVTLPGVVTRLGLHMANHSSSGGWLGSSAHNEYPMFTEDWYKARSKRRRFIIHADTHEVDDTTGLPFGLGGVWSTDKGQGYGYLPTNDPSTDAYFDENGALLATLPTTLPPGIRPDGMYSGHPHPQLSVTGYTFNGANETTIPSLKMIDGSNNVTPAPGSFTWQILDTYIEDGNDEGYFSTNPAVWETEPKEDIGLDIYHEVGQIYPTELNESTIGQFFGPIHVDLARNSQVTCWMPGTGGGMVDLETAAGGKDIRLYQALAGINGEVFVIMQDINGNPLDITNALVAPPVGSRLMFTRADGSRTETSVKTLPTPGVLFNNVFEVETDAHNYEVVLPWFNAYSFGNGVESNRIRDDYNQVIIDKGPKVSTVLEEPYSEERTSSGFIYSGIYSSMSGVNNLNQFIQAEKITKDLNPSYGSIQKLFTRNTNLVTLCEDKVFKILANKDALFNADGNINLTASENVLGQTIPFSGDYGISTNPESFASDAYRIYFADRSRGSVLRLSQDGLTPISSIGMTDWFADNLSGSNRIAGTFDGKKNEYNISLSYYNYSSLDGKIIGNSKDFGITPYKPTNIISVTGSVASQISLNDDIIGPGFPAGTFVVDKINQSGGVWLIQLNQPPLPADVAPLGDAVAVFYPTSAEAYWRTRFSSSAPDTDPLTLSFSEVNKGWVSFKSFHFEDGLSLNNDYFTFKGGQLFKHHSNPSHNTFYGDFTESSVEVLFNEMPGSVKSFQTLNYEGSQSKVTADVNNSGEYWDNYNKLGWYVDKMHTNLQEGARHEFKDKEGKWFSAIKGVATEWLDDGTGGNIDTNEFSYQGIDEAGALDGGGQYTSWDCSLVEATDCRDCRGKSLSSLVVPISCSALPCINGGTDFFWSNPAVNINNQSFMATVSGVPLPDPTVFGCGGNGGGVWDSSAYSNSTISFIGANDVAGCDNIADPNCGSYYDRIETTVADEGNSFSVDQVTNTGLNGEIYNTYTLHYTSVNDIVQWFIDNVDGTAFYLGMSLTQFINAGQNSGFMYAAVVGNIPADTCYTTFQTNTHTCIEVQGLVGTVDGGPYATKSACEADANAPCSGTCVVPNTVVPHVNNATQASGCANGDAAVEVTLMGAATEWEVEYVDSNTGNVVYIDPRNFSNNNPYNYSPGWSDPAPLAVGTYAARVTDDLGCVVEVPFPLECLTSACPPNPHVINQFLANATLDASGGCAPDGAIELNVVSLGNNAGYIDQIELFSVSGGVSTSIQVDMGDYYINNTINFNNLAEGDYEYTITDDIGCPYTESFTITCFTSGPGCTDPAALNYDSSAFPDDGSCEYPCDGSLSYDSNRDIFVSTAPFTNYIELKIDNIIADSCEANPVSMTSNASIELEILSIPASATTFSFEVIPGNNVDPYFTTSSGYNIPWVGSYYWSYAVPLQAPPATGDWSVTITDDLGNTECYRFTIGCEETPASWDCDEVFGNCYDPGTGLGQYSSLLDCQNNCSGIDYPHGRYNVFRFCRTHHGVPYPENVSLEVLTSPAGFSGSLWDKIQSITDLTPGYAAAYGNPISGSQNQKMYRRYNPDFWPNGLAEITFKVTWQSGHTKTFIMKASIKSPLTHNTLFRNSGGLPQQPPQMYDCYYQGPYGPSTPLQYIHDVQSGSMRATYDPNSVNPIGTISKAEVLSDPAGLLVNHREAYHHMCLCSTSTVFNNTISAGVWDLESTWGDGFKPNLNSNQEQVIKIHTAVVEANSNLKYQADNGTSYENVLDIVADFTPQQVNSYTGLGEVWTSNGGQNIFGSINNFFQTHSALGQESFFFETLVYADKLNC